MYEVLFISRIIPTEIEDEVRKKMSKTMDDAALAWQKHILEGLDFSGDVNVSLANFLPIRSWPKYYNDPFIKKLAFSHNGISNDINLPFCNIMLVKRLFQGYSLNKYIKEWAQSDKENKIIVTYTLYPEFLDAIRVAKKYDPSIKATAIVLDLPEYSILTKKMNPLNSLYLSWSKKKADGLLRYVDSFALLTESMKYPLGVMNKRYCIIEGICSDEFKEIDVVRDDIKTIFYAGTLHARFGILNLLEAFKCISNSNYRLMICGFGDSEDDICKAAKLDNRIIFMGQLSRKEILPLMQKATVIVNPRQDVEEFTKYSFPSKDMEALSSGIPFVGYKLSGIPDEYDKYINYPKSNSIKDLSDVLIEVCENEAKFFKKADHAKKWVLDSKNKESQARKLIELFS